MICTSVIPCLSRDLAKSNKNVSMFLLLSWLFWSFLKIWLFSKMEDKQDTFSQLFNSTTKVTIFFKKPGYLDLKVKTNLTADTYQRQFQQKPCFGGKIVAFWTVSWGQR